VRRPRVWRELLAVAWLYAIYDGLNDQAPLRQRAALAHGAALLRVERVLHVDLERSADRWTAHHHLVALALADYDDVAHLWLTLAVLVWLWVRRREAYSRKRTVLVGVNVVGFAVFWLWPVAPPRLQPGFVDVVAATHAWSSWHSGALATRANQLAAMPSLHVAWAVWVALALRQTRPGRWGPAIGTAHVALTVAAVVATGNHYTLDVVAGAATTALAVVVVGATVGAVAGAGSGSRARW
jgi:hypothetical protein